jgi:hypothetical protein
MLNGSSLGPFLRENQPKYVWQVLVKEHELSIVSKGINHEHPILKWLAFGKKWTSNVKRDVSHLQGEEKKIRKRLADFLLLFMRTIFLFSDGWRVWKTWSLSISLLQEFSHLKMTRRKWDFLQASKFTL